jgi:hypothetical protein
MEKSEAQTPSPHGMNANSAQANSVTNSQHSPSNLVDNPKKPPTPERPKQTTKYRHDQAPRWKIFLDAVMAAIGLMAVVVYGCQLWVMKGQLTEMKDSGKQTDQLISLYEQQLIQLQKQASNTHDLSVTSRDQVDATKKSITAVQRAFVTFSRLKVSFGDPGDIVFQGVWQNSGNTPASSVTQYISSDWRQELLPLGFRYRDKPANKALLTLPSNYYIAPHDQADGTLFKVPRKVLEQVGSGREFVHFWGWVNYKDTFGCYHRTEFCMRIIGYSPEQEKILSTVCPEHVCADKDCKNYTPTQTPMCRAEQ